MADSPSYASGRLTVLTIGYGNRGFARFVELAHELGLTHIVDVRSVPESSYWEEFRRRNLEFLIPESGLKYVYMGDTLGGVKGSATLCKEPGKVDIAPLSETPTFRLGLEKLWEAAQDPEKKLALMCGCLRPHQCHRARLIAPAAEARGLRIVHVDHKDRLVPHEEIFEDIAVQKELFAS